MATSRIVEDKLGEADNFRQPVCVAKVFENWELVRGAGICRLAICNAVLHDGSF
jgi:hypothetical protein